MTEVSAGQKILAAHNNDLHNRIIWVVKAVDESVTSSITVQDDDELSLTLPANGTYKVDLDLGYTADPAGDITTAWNSPSGVTLKRRFSRGLGHGVTSAVDQDVRLATRTSLTDELGYGGIAAGTWLREVLYLTTGVSDATLTFRWAQRVSSPTATTVLAGSTLTATSLLS